MSVEGKVDIRRTGGWQIAKSGSSICTGDSIRVQRYSRAAIRLPDKTVLRLDQNTSLTFAEPEDDTGSWLDLLRGIIHVISRDPRALRFNTPYANAGLEGTEFVIAVSDEDTDVTVLEGEVLLSNSAGTVSIPSRQRGVARLAQAPTAEAIANPVEAIGWTPYYAGVLDGALPGADQAPTKSSEPDFFVRRAGHRLSVGRVNEALEDLGRALTLHPSYADALALQSLIVLTAREYDRALALARAATADAPGSATAWLSLSYAYEASFELEQALDAATTAVSLAPDHAFAHARRAELELALGDDVRARGTLQRALALDPNLSHAHAILGFAQLRRQSSTEAVTCFETAIRLEPAAPLPRLGLGLALAHQGRLEEAREQVEVAVVLDPTEALSRSYMAKVYDTEGRGPLSASQLELAKELGSRDPTAWFYDALRKQAENRPVEALQDLQTAIDLNGNEAVYRSRLLVDEDLAARSAGIGRLYSTLGFEQLALLQGWQAVASDATDHSGHRLLADVYSYLPRHQIARVNELFQTQLMQPINVTPVRAQLAEANMFVLDTIGPSALSFHEFQPLLRTNGVSLQGSAVTANNGTHGFDFTVAGLNDRLSYNVGHFDLQTDGFRTNNDLSQQVTSALVQFRPAAETSVFTELRASRIEKGDLQLLFDPDAFHDRVRQNESLDSLRAGLRHDLPGNGTLVAAIVADRIGSTAEIDDTFMLSSDRRAHALDAQYLYSGDRWHLTAGGRRLIENVDDTLERGLDPLGGEPTVEVTPYRLEYSNVYAYGSVALTDDLDVLVGASVDSVDGRYVARDRVNPKLGIMWQASAKTTLRAAAFRTLQEPFVSKFNIRPTLEPTHVAGFNQQFFGSEGESAWRYGTAVDHRFSENVYAGIEVSRRDLEVPLITVPPDPSLPPIWYSPEIEESVRRGYLYWTPSPRISASFTYQYEQFDNGGFAYSDGLTRVRTHRLPVEVNFFHDSGFSAGITTTWVDQAGEFTPMQFGPDAAAQPGADRFRVTDLSLRYRLPSRRGQISLNAHNVFDETFRFQDTDPENPRILPERMVLLKMTLSY